MKKTVLALAGLALASVAWAQLSKHKDWAKSAEAYFLSPSEREEWAKLKTDEEAEKFIAAYWARRGGDRFKVEIERRIAAADEQFKMRRYAKGSDSVRGRVFVVLGPPSRAMQSRMGGTSGEATPDTGLGGLPSGGGAGRSSLGDQSPAAIMSTWTYDKDKFDPSWGIGDLRIRFNVDAQRGSDEVMDRSAAERAIAKVAEKSIVNAGATGAAASAAPPPVKPAVPAAGTGPAASAAPAPAAPASAAAAPPPPPVSATLPAATRASLDAILKESKESGSFWGGSFHTVNGDYFYAFEFYIPGDKAPAGALRFGGVVTSEAGAEAASYWEDASLADMKTGPRTDKVYERSVVLPPGNYKAAFGLFPADGSTAVVSSAASLRLGPKSTDFEISPLMLANTLTPLTKRPSPTDPFVFGMEKPIKVEPKGNRVFAKEDNLWYFYTVSNPVLSAGSAPAAPTPAAGAPPAPMPTAPEAKPRVMTRIGVLRDGKPAFAPFSGPAELQVLAPGYYATGSEIPLASFEPGYYSFTLNVRDLNAPRDSAAFKGIDRKEDFIVLKPDGTMPEKAAAKPEAKPPAKPAPKATPKKG